MNYQQAIQAAWQTHQETIKAARIARMEAMREAWQAYDQLASAATKTFKEVMNSEQPDQP